MHPHYEVRLYRGSYALYWHDGTTSRRRSLGTTDRQVALRRKAEIERIETDLRRDTITVEDAWTGYRESLVGRPAATTMGYEGKTILPHFGHLAPATITDEIVDAYIASRRAKGRKDGAILTELNRLSSALAWAVKRNKLSAKPHIKRVPAPPPKDVHVTREEAKRLMAATDVSHVRLFILLALSTGARASAILELTWDRVDLSRRLVDYRVPDQKRPMKQRVLCPINDTLMAALAATERTSDYVVSWGGHRVLSVKKGVATACAAAGLTDVTPHVFRHSAAVWLAEAGVEMSVISQFLGHADTKVTEAIYARYSPAYMRGPVSALDF